MKWLFEYINPVWKYDCYTYAFTLYFRALHKNIVFDAVHFVSWEEFFQAIWSDLVIAVGGQGTPWGATHNPAGSHRINWDSAKQSKLLNRRLTSVRVRRKFRTKRMGERAPSVVWCVPCVRLMWSFSFLLSFIIFLSKSLETNCTILHNYTKMLCIPFFFFLFF